MKVPLSTLLGFVFLLALVCVQAEAQSEAVDKAELAFSFGALTNREFRGRVDIFMVMIANRPDSQGLILFYGTPAQLAERKRLAMSHFALRGMPLERISYKVGGNVSDFRTEFWIIPKGAGPPKIKPEAWIAGEFGRVYKKDAFKKIADFLAESRELHDHQRYIINYGTPAEIAMREKWITNSLSSRTSERTSIVNGGLGPVGTVLWLVPRGAENPTP